LRTFLIRQRENWLSCRVKGKEIIKRGPELNVWRAPLANETDEWAFGISNSKHLTGGFGHMVSTEWYSAGLDKLQTINELFSFRKTEENNVIVEDQESDVTGYWKRSIYESFYIQYR
jgi:beta-galactosidase